MSNTLTLMKMEVLNSFLSLLGKDRKKAVTRIVLFVFLGLFVGIRLYETASAVTIAGIEYVSLMIFAIFIFYSLFAAFKMTYDLLYRSKNVDILLSMPLKTSEILISKTFAIVVSQLIGGLVVMIPVFAALIIEAGIGVDIILRLVLMIITEVIALTMLGIIIASLYVKLESIHPLARTILKYVTFILIIVGALFMREMIGSIVNLLISNDALSGFLGLLFDYSQYAVNGNLLILILITAIFVVAFYFVSLAISKFYLGILTGLGAHRKKYKAYRVIGSKNIYVSLIAREFRRLLGNLMYAFNVLFVPVLFTITIFITLSQLSGELEFGYTMLSNRFRQTPAITVLIIWGVCSFITLNSTTFYSLSLEGEEINHISSFPIKSTTFIDSKIMFNMIINMAFVIPVTILVLTIIKQDVSTIILYIVLITLSLLIMSIFGALINLQFPRFVFNNPNEIIKRSVGAFASVGASLVLIFMIGGIARYIFQNLNNTFFTDNLLYILIGVLSIVGIGLFIFSRWFIPRRFLTMEKNR